MSRPLQLQPKVLVMLGVGPGTYLILTADARVSGSVLAPQKFLLSQQFRHLMRCKKYLEKFFLSCLTEVVGEGGTDCPPQKILSSQKFRHLMG